MPAAQPTGYRDHEEEAWPWGLERELRPAGSGGGSNWVKVSRWPDHEQEGEAGSWVRGHDWQ